MINKKKYIGTNWEGRFFDPTIQWAYVATNTHSKAITVSNISGKFQLHAHDFENGYDRQVTKKKNGALFGSISPDGKYIYYLNDTIGNENGHFVRTSFIGGKTIDMTPDIPPYFSYTLGIDNSNDTFCFTASFPNENKVYIFSEKNIRLSSTQCIYKSKKSISEAIISGNGNYTCFAVSEEKHKDSSECILIDNKLNKVQARCEFKGTITPIAFSNEEKPIVLVLSNESGKHRPVLCNLLKNKKTIIESSDFKGDVFVLLWDKEGENILVCDVYSAHHNLFLYNLHTKKTKRIGPKTGSFDLFFGSVVLCKDKSFLVRWSDFNTPSRYIKINAPKYDKWENWFILNKRISSKYPVKNVQFLSTHNTKVQMWVINKNMKKTSPFIIDIHGGPHSVVSDEYSPEVHAWLENGFGYCAVNYRGSTGFGKKFEEKIYGNPGNWEVEDIVAARNWLVKNHLADPSHIVISGWSWGGFVTLLALGKYPNLWRVGIAGASITDCIMQYEDEPAFFKAIDQKRFRGTPISALRQYIKSSPTTYAKNIKAPLLILHGKNDVRCPPRQIKYFEKIMQKAKKDITVRWYSSGHTGDYTNLSLRVSLLKEAVTFAKKNNK